MELCENCENYKGIEDLGFGCKKIVCNEFGIISVRKESLKSNCFKQRKKQEIIMLEPNFYGVGIDVKKLWKTIKDKIFKK